MEFSLTMPEVVGLIVFLAVGVALAFMGYRPNLFAFTGYLLMFLSVVLLHSRQPILGITLATENRESVVMLLLIFSAFLFGIHARECLLAQKKE